VENFGTQIAFMMGYLSRPSILRLHDSGKLEYLYYYIFH